MELQKFNQIKIELEKHVENLKAGKFSTESNEEVFDKFKQRILFWNLK